MKNLRAIGVDRRTAFDRVIDSYLEKIQEKLMPEKAEMIVAINVQTGEYALGEDFGEAAKAFHKRWPKGAFYMCRVNGTPAIRM
jgi:hypothetical protein